MERFDVAVIGAGVVGASIARELSRYKLSTVVVERCEDVCSGTSKANSAIVHAGYDAVPGSLKAKFNVRGAELIRELSKKLDFDYRENGSMVISLSPEGHAGLVTLLEKGEKNGVKDLEIISGDRAREMEPALSPEVVEALLVPHGAIVCPFLMTIAFAENAAENGAEFRFLENVTGIMPDDGRFILSVNGEEKYDVKYVVNAAGVYADKINNMVSARKLSITPRRGEYVLMDREVGGLVNHTIFQLPTKLGKGVLVTPTVHGNLLVGPNADPLEDKEDISVTADGMDEIKSKALLSVPSIPYNKMITSFAGLRAHESGNDFIIGEAEDCEGFFNAAGIASPGLSSAPAIGEYLAKLIAEKAGAQEKSDFIDERKGFIRITKLSPEERNVLIAERPEYGRIVCRCEEVTEGEIEDAIRRPVGARSLDGIKRRVRQGMGRCQAGFCTPKAIEILARELGISEEDVCKNIPGSEMLTGEVM
ncbi:MAG: NAD(P)/FAD-dependent oxidoreductase [Eubacterium sp.]|nr:NAD(P)/FAD-dependent oxidoreductase [Eubacterium sp.]